MLTTQKHILPCCYLVLLIFMASCSPKLYGPQGQTVPLIDDKGQIYAAGGLVDVPGESAAGFHLNAAASVSEKVAITASGYFVQSVDEWDVSASVVEFGGGTFKRLGDSRWLSEAYMGVGFGSFKNEQIGTTDFINVNFTKWYLQPSIGWGSDYFQMAFTPRLALVNYGDPSSRFTEADDRREADTFFDEQGTTLVLEPGITVRAGSKTVKFQVQYVYSTFGNPVENNPVQNDILSISLVVMPKKED